MSLSHRFLWCTLIISLPFATGCFGSSDEGRLPTKPLAVTVTHNGQPVAGATVSFVDEAGTAPAFGQTDAQGVAKMKTYEEEDGVVYGTHRISVIKSEIVGEQEAADQDSEEYDPLAAEQGPPVMIKPLIPAKYASPVTSGLTAQINDDSPEEMKIELVD